MSATIKAAVHLLEKMIKNILRTIKNTEFDMIKPFFDITLKLIVDQEHERHGIFTFDWGTNP